MIYILHTTVRITKITHTHFSCGRSGPQGRDIFVEAEMLLLYIAIYEAAACVYESSFRSKHKNNMNNI